jgi:hypothetical protein
MINGRIHGLDWSLKDMQLNEESAVWTSLQNKCWIVCGMGQENSENERSSYSEKPPWKDRRSYTGQRGLRNEMVNGSGVTRLKTRYYVTEGATAPHVTVESIQR